jgi:hypothetical protein
VGAFSPFVFRYFALPLAAATPFNNDEFDAAKRSPVLFGLVGESLSSFGV